MWEGDYGASDLWDPAEAGMTKYPVPCLNVSRKFPFVPLAFPTSRDPISGWRGEKATPFARLHPARSRVPGTKLNPFFGGLEGKHSDNLWSPPHLFGLTPKGPLPRRGEGRPWSPSHLVIPADSGIWMEMMHLVNDRTGGYGSGCCVVSPSPLWACTQRSSRSEGKFRSLLGLLAAIPFGLHHFCCSWVLLDLV